MNYFKNIREETYSLTVQSAIEMLKSSNTKNYFKYSDIFNKSIQEHQKPKISIILPVYNEQENLSETFKRLKDILNKEEIVKGSFELVFVNDGSKDDSIKFIREFRENDSRVKLINLSRNFGHQAAITAGIDFCHGDAVILMDADLQDPPEVLSKMISEWLAGAEVVYAVRQKRKENFLKKGAYFTFYRLLQFIANIEIPLDSGDFCLMDRKVVEQLKSMPERNRFLRGLRSWVGFKQVALPYERQARFAGEAKYTFRKLLKLALDGILSFSSFPLRLATYLGFTICLLGLIYSIFVIEFYLTGGEVPQGWTTLIVLVLLIGGVQLLILGTIGEYIARIYDEVKQRPNYIIKEILD